MRALRERRECEVVGKRQCEPARWSEENHPMWHLGSRESNVPEQSRRVSQVQGGSGGGVGGPAAAAAAAPACHSPISSLPLIQPLLQLPVATPYTRVKASRSWGCLQRVAKAAQQAGGQQGIVLDAGKGGRVGRGLPGGRGWSAPVQLHAVQWYRAGRQARYPVRTGTGVGLGNGRVRGCFGALALQQP